MFGARRPHRTPPSIIRVDFRNPARPSGSKLAALEELGRTLGGRLGGAFSALLQTRIRVEPEPVRSGTLQELAGEGLGRDSGRGQALGAIFLDGQLEEHLALRLLGVPPPPAEEDEGQGEGDEGGLPPEDDGGEADPPAGPSETAEPGSVASNGASGLQRTPMVRAALEGAMSSLLEATNAVLEEAGGNAFHLRASAGSPRASLTETEAAHAFDFVVREGKSGGRLTVVLPDRSVRPCVTALEPIAPAPVDPASARALEAVVRGIDLGVTARLGGAQVSLFDEVLHLEVGDVLVLDRRLGEPVELLAGGQTLFEGHLGTARGRIGIRLSARRQD